MNEEIIEKPTLEYLLNQDLHDLISCLASGYYAKYGYYNAHAAMISQEDLILEGYVGVTVAYESFDPNLGNKNDIHKAFRTYTYPYIRNSMMTYCRKFSHSLSTSEKAARDDFGNMIDINVVHIDQLENDEEFDVPIGSGIEISHDVDEYFFLGFSQFERSMVTDHVIYGYSLQEISTRHRISKSRAGEIIRGLLDRMKERAEHYVENN